MIKKITTTLIIATLMLLSSFATFAAEENSVINVYVNDNSVKWTDAKPFIDSNGRSMIPLRAVAENLGAEVTWNNSTSTAKVVLGSKTVELQVGRRYGMVNGAKVEMDSATIIINGRTFIPLRFVSENLGYDITYKFGRDERADNKTAHIIDIRKKNGINTINDFLAGDYKNIFNSNKNGYFYEELKREIRYNVEFLSDDYISFSSRVTSTRTPGGSTFTVERYNGNIVISQYSAFDITDDLAKQFLNDILDYLFQDESKVLKDEIIGSFLSNRIATDDGGGIYSLTKVLETSKKVGRFTVSYTEKSIPNFETSAIKIIIKY